MIPWEIQKDREWRARLRVQAFVTLPETFALFSATCSSRDVGIEADGRRQILVDLRYVSEDVESAYFQALDMAEELVDRLSFLCLAGTDVSVASVTYPTAKIGGTFEIAMPVPNAGRSPVRITADEISQFDGSRSEATTRALRLFRTGVSSGSSYHALGQLWAAAEVLGRECALRDGNNIEHRCKECGAIQKGPPRTQPYIEGFLDAVLEKKGATSQAADAAEAARETRGKVIHGGKLQDRTLRREVDDHLGHLQSGVAVALSRAMSVKASILRARRVGDAVMYAQVTAHECMVAADQATVLADMRFGKWAVDVRGGLPAIPNECGRDQAYDIAVGGLTFPMIVPNLFWPTITA